MCIPLKWLEDLSLWGVLIAFLLALMCFGLSEPYGLRSVEIHGL